MWCKHALALVSKMADAEESFNSNSEEVITDYTEKDEEKESIVMNNGEVGFFESLKHQKKSIHIVFLF